MKAILFYLHIPIILLDLLFSWIFRYIPKLNLIYKINASIVDTDRSLSYHTLQKQVDEWGKPIFKQIKFKDISNKKLKYSLILTFKRWYVYDLGVYNTTSNSTDENRRRIYISRDKLTAESFIEGERISEWLLSKNYSSKKLRLHLKSKGLDYDEFYKLEPQFYVICAKKSKHYDKMRSQRDKRYSKKKHKKLTKQVKKAIKNDRLYRRVSSWDDQTPLNLAVEANRYDLIEKILKFADKINERKKVLNYGHTADWDDYSKITYPLDMAKNEEMEKYLTEKGAEKVK